MNIEYNPTLENISLTEEQEILMVQAMQHICDAPSALKKTTRCQFWFKQIWKSGYEQALKEASNE